MTADRPPFPDSIVDGLRASSVNVIEGRDWYDGSTVVSVPICAPIPATSPIDQMTLIAGGDEFEAATMEIRRMAQRMKLAASTWTPGQRI